MEVATEPKVQEIEEIEEIKEIDKIKEIKEIEKIEVEEQKEVQYETYNYSADTASIMSILSSSIYTDKDVFLRELISNGSDAINKACLANNKYKLNNCIKISYNPDTHKLIICDTGCGITKHDLINKIGCIGTSGTKQFIENIAKGNNNLIGQFGVGFYSAYMVASKIEIITKPIDENKIWEWVSESESKYSIREIDNFVPYGFDTFNNGTQITLTLKPDAYGYLENEKLMNIIKTHSSYIEYDILFEKHVDVKDAEGHYSGDKVKEWEKMTWIPLWKRSRSEITHQEYMDWYFKIPENVEQHVKDEPIIYKHFVIEGSVVNFSCILYFPKKAPFNLFEKSNRGQLKLYTKNVLITADHEDLYPKWMEFVKGVVETSDIELNVSRQTVQNTKKLRIIYNQLVKKVIEMMEELAENEETYNKFYKEFSCSIKNGINEEFSRRPDRDDYNDRMVGNGYGKRMLKLLKYHTSLGRFVGFDDYVKNMKPNQKAIYYISGDKKEALELSPFMDKLKSLNLEVFYFEEPIDEYMKGFLHEYKVYYNKDGTFDSGNFVGIHDQGFERYKEPDLNDLTTKTFVDVSRDKLLLSNLDEISEIDKNQGIELCSKLKELYDNIGIKLFEVKLDEKFDSTPAIIVNHVHLSAQLEKLLNNSASTKRNIQYQDAFERKDMLISSSNKITKYLYKKLCDEKVSIKDEYIIDIARTIYTCALIGGGYEPDNAFRFIKKFNELLSSSFDI